MTDFLLTKFASETAEEPSGLAALGLDGKAFVIQLITFLLVFYILKRFVFNRVVDLLEKRRETIEAGMRLTTEMSAEKDKLEKDVAKIRSEARKEADEIIARTQQQASTMIKEAEEAAASKAKNVLNEAQVKITEETARARRKLEAEVVDLVIEATEAVAGEKLDAKKDAHLIAKALKGQA